MPGVHHLGFIQSPSCLAGGGSHSYTRPYYQGAHREMSRGPRSVYVKEEARGEVTHSVISKSNTSAGVLLLFLESQNSLVYCTNQSFREKTCLSCLFIHFCQSIIQLEDKICSGLIRKMEDSASIGGWSVFSQKDRKCQPFTFKPIGVTWVQIDVP